MKVMKTWGLSKTLLRRFGYTHVHRMHSFLDWNTQIYAVVVVVLFRGCPYVSFDCMRSFPLCNKGIFLLVMDSDNWRRSSSRKASLFRVISWTFCETVAYVQRIQAKCNSKSWQVNGAWPRWCAEYCMFNFAHFLGRFYLKPKVCIQIPTKKIQTVWKTSFDIYWAYIFSCEFYDWVSRVQRQLFYNRYVEKIQHN